MRINYNVSAMISNNSLSKSENALTKSLERLSSGLKINHGKDNPAGLAMGKRMNAQLEGLSVASQNAANGVSVIEIADGALSEMHAILQRMNELSIKASTGSITDEDREMVDKEVQELKEELTRIKNATQFNGQHILNGEFDLKGYTDDLDVKVSGYSEKTPNAVYRIDDLTLDVVADADGNITEVTVNTFIPTAQANFPQDIKTRAEFPADAKVTEIKDNRVTIKGGNGFELQLDLSKGLTAMEPMGPNAAGTYQIQNIDVDLTGIGDLRLQIGANEGQVLEMQIPEVSLKNMGIEELDMTTQDNAKDAIDRIKGAISYISGVRSHLGAYQNRLESTINNLDITTENMTASYSRIMDVDMAEEMTEYTKLQVLTQAGTSMLAQANQRPSQVRQLLQ